jgi:hypothetical protein
LRATETAVKPSVASKHLYFAPANGPFTLSTD